MDLLPLPDATVGRALEDITSLVELAERVVVVPGDEPVRRVDRMFRLEPDLQAVVVEVGRSYALLTRDQVQRELDGRLGYGRALHQRSRVADLLPSETFSLPGHLALVEAARRILARPIRQRYADVLVLTEHGPRVVTVSRVFERVSAIYHHVALHDPLTGLPNRRLLDQHGSLMVDANPGLEQVAILYIDLDGFKTVNDTFGHRVGDEILIGFAERLRGCVRPGDVVARLGGDEFAALLTDTSEVQAAAIADRVVLTATAPFVHDDQVISLSATVGVAMASDITRETELTQLDVLLRHADGAMLKAKTAGKRRVGRLDSRREVVPFARHGHIRRRLREALDSGAFTLHYQPKLDLHTDDCLSVEALVRWDDVELGPVSPAEFIPIAETADDIHRLGRWVIQEACAQARRWVDAGTPRTIAVNVSPKQLTTGELVAEILRAVADHGVPPSMLRIELTEGSAIVDLPGAIDQLGELRQVGVQVDLDDFGTGYSSLEMLHHLPLSAVKIDKTFIDNIDESQADALMIRGVIDAAHALGLTVIAEGVERQTQLDILRELGCDSAQGYLISRPVPADVLEGATAAV
jgi:diguanylate cyclase (GGDEF)-like protein